MVGIFDSDDDEEDFFDAMDISTPGSALGTTHCPNHFGTPHFYKKVFFSNTEIHMVCKDIKSPSLSTSGFRLPDPRPSQQWGGLHASRHSEPTARLCKYRIISEIEFSCHVL